MISETSDMQKVKHVLCWVRAKPGIILLSSLQNFLLLRERKEVIKLCCVLSQKRTSFGSKRNWLFLQTQCDFLAVCTAGPYASSLAEPNTVLALTFLHRLSDKWHLPFQEELWQKLQALGGVLLNTGWRFLKTLQLTLNSGERSIFHEVHVKLWFEEWVSSKLLIVCLVLRGKLLYACGIMCPMLNMGNSKHFYKRKIPDLGEL